MEVLNPKAGSNVFCSRIQCLGGCLCICISGAQSNQVKPCHLDQSQAKNLYSRPLVGSTSRFQDEQKQSIYPNQLAIKYQPRIPLSLHLNRRFKYISKIYRFSQLAACRIGKRWIIPPIVEFRHVCGERGARKSFILRPRLNTHSHNG